MKLNRMILFLFFTTQIIGFSLLWYKSPNSKVQVHTPDHDYVAILDKLKDLKLTQQHGNQNDGMAMTPYYETETFRTALRQILKEELTAALRNQTVVTNAALSRDGQTKSIDELPLTPEQKQQRAASMAASREIIEQAIAEGEWDMADVDAMTPYVNDLSHAQRKELIELYLQNIGEKALSEGVPPPPL